MPINKNHEFEDLEGVKCSIVERNVLPERVEFLKNLLEYNRFNVMIVPTPAAKPVAAKPAPKPIIVEGEPATPVAVVEEPIVPLPTLPATFTVGVTDVMFNSTNAIFGRLLHTRGGQKVTLAYWQQNEVVSNDEVPYYENKI